MQLQKELEMKNQHDTLYVVKIIIDYIDECEYSILYICIVKIHTNTFIPTLW